MNEETNQRPILFSTEMVAAIRAGKKTQTRRICKPCLDPVPVEYDGMWMWKQGVRWGAVTNPTYPPCPYGVVGDKLYMRETWWAWGHWESDIDRATGKPFKSFEWHSNTYAMGFLENFPDKPDWNYPSGDKRDEWHKDLPFSYRKTIRESCSKSYQCVLSSFNLSPEQMQSRKGVVPTTDPARQSQPITIQA